jgi:hypothetical protein
MDIRSEITNQGIRFAFHKNFDLKYPDGAWTKLSNSTKKSFQENLAYLKFAGYGAIVDEPISFSTAKPLLKKFIDNCARGDFPHFAFEDKTTPSKLANKFKDARFIFSGDDSTTADEPDNLEEGGVLALSLGKDSLLSYGLMRELGIKRKLVFFEDDWALELFHKKKLMAKFEKEFKEKIHIGIDETDTIHEDPLINKTHSEGIYGSNAMNGYVIMTVPFAYHFKLNTMVFGNEQNFNDQFTDDEGNKAYPSFDQSSGWMAEQNKMLALFTGKKISLNSYVEPLYNLAEVKVLFHRYPEIAKYQASCTHSMQKNDNNRWCFGCPMCAKAFLYLAANGFSPKIVDFNLNFFDEKYAMLYPLFNPNPMRAYEKPRAVRDEQLLAFYLTYKNGFKGQLIDRFRKEHLKEAKERGEELRKRFFGIHKAKTLPSSGLMKELRSLYKEELSN